MITVYVLPLRAGLMVTGLRFCLIRYMPIDPGAIMPCLILLLDTLVCVSLVF